MSKVLMEIQKRLTLNWLIQGAAQHAGMTFHHLVRDELNVLNPKLVRLYDQYALINLLQYWQPEAKMLLGSPSRYWKRATQERSHPFFNHPLLSQYGGVLAEESRQRGLSRCEEKGLTKLPIAFTFQTLLVIERLRAMELPQQTKLVQLGKRTASLVWGIPMERLDAELASKIVLPPDLLQARNLTGAAFRAGIVGLGGVVRREGKLIVVAKATNWQLLAKELVKGTAELICLHGLNQLDDETYEQVLRATDRLDLEPWMLQSGGELWRRLLQFVPNGCSIAEVLMHLARLPAGTLELLIADVIEQRKHVVDSLEKLVKA
ncbi:MAG: hypothetical protein H0X66_13290 [Verrucomicrobia bacterium]|nr:hypothetical protein [Verrucomicrobiota bacterium]